MFLYFTQIEPPEPETLAVLERKGWQCLHFPFRRAELLEVNPPEPFGQFDALILTSRRAAQWLLAGNYRDLPPLAVVGAATAQLLQDHRLLFPKNPPPNAAALVSRLRKRFSAPARFLFLKGEAAPETLKSELQPHEVTVSTVYRTVPIEEKTRPLQQPAMVYFQAPSTVSDFMERYGKPPARIAAIGPSTAAALSSLGWAIDFQAERPETASFAATLPAAKFFQKDELGKK